MNKKIINDFIDKTNIEIIKELMKINNGYIFSKQITELGIHRMYINIMVKEGIIEKVGRGIYMDVRKMEDPYYIFNISNSSTIFSHMTALYFHGLSIKAPNQKYDITIKKDYHNPKIDNHDIFYVSNELYSLGITTTLTPSGNKIKLYDIERCICDIIRSKKRMDIEHIKYSIKEYLKRKDKDLNKLSIYAEKMGIKEEVMDFVSMMYE